MATPSIVPRANGEGGIGTSEKRWKDGYFNDIDVVGQVKTNSVNATGDISVGGNINANSIEGVDGVFSKLVVAGKKITQLMIEAQPNFYSRPNVPKPNKTVVTIPKGTLINIGNNGYTTYSDVVLELSSLATADARKGRDVYIYACQPSVVTDIEPVFVLSFNSTVPDGYTAENSRKIGGFHCLCAAIGNISGHSLSGYAAGDIIPSSVWDLYWRATSQNEGMSYDDGVGFWVDIYLPSWDGNKLVSVYGGVIVDGYSAKAMHGELFVEEAGRVGKFLIDRAEFMVITRGTPQKTNISGSADPNTTGGHVDTNGVRIVSNSGIEDLCGVMWQWTRDIMGIENANSNAERTTGFVGATAQTSSAEGDHWRYGLQWQEDGRGTANINIDGSTNVRGMAYGGLVRANVGGNWDNGARCGGRSVDWGGLSSSRDSYISARCGSMPRVVNAA